MKTQTHYEWTLEVLKDGEIEDNDFSDTLPKEWVELSDGVNYQLALVRNTGNEAAGLTDRMWAYADGELPEYFSGSMGEKTCYRVPQKYISEFNKINLVIKILLTIFTQNKQNNYGSN